MGKSIRSSSIKKNHSIQSSIVKETVENPRTQELSAKLQAHIAATEARMAAARAEACAADDDSSMGQESETTRSSKVTVPEATTAILRVSSKMRAKAKKHRVTQALRKTVVKRSGSSISKFISR
eukprot:ANDGO_02052.mRNA.1 hypothetical protein